MYGETCVASLGSVHKKRRGAVCPQWYDVEVTGLQTLHDALAQLRGHAAVDVGLREALAPLLAYDDERGTDLAHTLVVFVQLGGNIAGTAETLFLHRNSVAYRLQRIEEVCRLDVRNPDVRRLLTTALSLADPRLLQELESERETPSSADDRAVAGGPGAATGAGAGREQG